MEVDVLIQHWYSIAFGDLDLISGSQWHRRVDTDFFVTNFSSDQVQTLQAEIKKSHWIVICDVYRWFMNVKPVIKRKNMQFYPWYGCEISPAERISVLEFHNELNTNIRLSKYILVGIIGVTVLLAVTETLHLRFNFLAMKTKVELHAYAIYPPYSAPAGVGEGGGGGGDRWAVQQAIYNQR